MEHKQPSELLLPVGVASKVDAGRLLREAEAVDEFLRQGAIRQGGTPVTMPKMSKLFEELVSINKLNVLQAPDRAKLKQLLEYVKAKSPVMHMSFSADPPPQFMVRLVTWLRSEIHPHVLVQVGLQPSIGAGCILRTSNKQFDFSLRQRFLGHKADLVNLIRLGSSKQVGDVPVAPLAEAKA